MLKKKISIIALMVAIQVFILFELSAIKTNKDKSPKVALAVTLIKPIPNQHIVFFAKTSLGIIPVIIPKGYLNPDNEGVYWQTIENYKKQMEMNRKFREHEKKSLEKYKKEHPEAFGKKEPV